MRDRIRERLAEYRDEALESIAIAEVSEFAPQVAQELCGVGDCFDWIKGVGKTARVRGRWHELRHALRACAAYCRRIEEVISWAKKSTGRSFSVPAAAIA